MILPTLTGIPFNVSTRSSYLWEVELTTTRHGRLVFSHAGQRWLIHADNVLAIGVPGQIVPCPHCGSEDTYDTGTTYGYRCNGCGEYFEEPTPCGECGEPALGRGPFPDRCATCATSLIAEIASDPSMRGTL